MAERESKQAEEDRARRRQKVSQSPSKQLEARDPSYETEVDVPSPESPGVLRDGRFSHPANIGQKARVVSQLQHSHGNAYVQRLLDSRVVQAKLVVNPVNDQYEREADRVAEAVVPASGAAVQRQAADEKEEEEVYAKPASGAPGPALQRQAEDEEEKEEEEVSTKPAGGRRPVASADLEARVQAQRGGGQPVGESTRASLEPHLGLDLSDVRIHADAEADEMSRQLNAKAFTTGKDVFFRSGDYQPGTTEGQKLLAHEMTHVAQQSEGASAPAARGTAPPTSTRAVGEGPAAASGAQGTSVARQEESDVTIARQPVEVKPPAGPAAPPPATPAPPLLTSAQATLWRLTVISNVEEALKQMRRRRPRFDKVSKAARDGKLAIPALIEATGVQPSTAKEMREVERHLDVVHNSASSLLVGGIDLPLILDSALKKAKQVGKGAGAPMPPP